MGTQGQPAFDAPPATGWNPYYVIYARALGRTPDAQIRIDRASGSMIDYMHWNHRQWRAWAAEVGRRHLDYLLSEEHAAFGVWLATRFP